MVKKCNRNKIDITKEVWVGACVKVVCVKVVTRGVIWLGIGFGEICV